MNISSEITINLLFNSGAVFGCFLDELNLIIVQNSNLQIPPMIAGDSITMVSAFLQRPRACLKSVYLIATRDLSNLWLQFFLSQNQGFMRLFEKTVLK